MQICAPLARSQFKVSDTQVDVRSVGFLLKVTIYVHKVKIPKKNVNKTKYRYWSDFYI